MRLVGYSGCPGLLSGLRTATERQTGPYGLPGGVSDMMRKGLPGAESGAAAPVAPGRAAGQAPDHSSTNAHEAGADEPDLVKTDGRRIVAIARGRLNVVDPATRRITGSLALTSRSAPWATADLLLSGDRALIIAPEQRTAFEGDMTGEMARPAGPAGRGCG
jgi:uncharacterized secreted protein with C-terminal beta-propeller domain